MRESAQQQAWWFSVQPRVGYAVWTEDILWSGCCIDAPPAVTALPVPKTCETRSRFHIKSSVLACCFSPELRAHSNLMTSVVSEGTLPAGRRGLRGNWEVPGCKPTEDLGGLREILLIGLLVVL